MNGLNETTCSLHATFCDLYYVREYIIAKSTWCMDICTQRFKVTAKRNTFSDVSSFGGEISRILCVCASDKQMKRKTIGDFID